MKIQKLKIKIIIQIALSKIYNQNTKIQSLF